ncbi:MAG: hypothetical protein JWM16_1854 [Verrucomicrobiales bacterium]|jgi:hypothetical protein|nr:hypothetical protein [Verrucomicrobiales bacterium]
MKNSPLAPLLAGALLLIGLMTAFISVRYYFSLKEYQKMQVEYAGITNKRNAVQALANESVEYSKTNSAIDPILFEFDLKPKPGATAPATGSKPGK